MKISSLIILLASLGFVTPALAADWDMTPTYAPAAQEMNQAQYQNVINPASLGGYSVSAPQNIGSILGSQSALSTGGAQGTVGNTSALTNQIIRKTSTAGNKPNLPACGTMGMAQVFGTGNDGLTSPGGYSPVIWIPGVGSVRIPQQIGIPGIPGVTVTTPSPSQLLNDVGL